MRLRISANISANESSQETQKARAKAAARAAGDEARAAKVARRGTLSSQGGAAACSVYVSGIPTDASEQVNPSSSHI